MTESEKVSRRGYVKYVGGIVVVAVVAAAGYGIYQATQPAPTTPSPSPTPSPTPTPTPTPTPGKKYSGKTLRILSYAFPLPDVLSTLVPEFEQETGSKVVYEHRLGWEDVCLRIGLDIGTPGVGEYDAWVVSADFRIAMEHAHPLTEFMENPSVVDKKRLAVDDYVPRVIKAGRFNGKQNWLGIPCVWVMAYRTDLFEKYGVSLPKNTDELLEVIKSLTIDENGDGKPEIYGYVTGHGYRDPITFSTFPWMRAYGAEVIDTQTFEVKANTPEMKDFLNFVVKLHKLMPPESIGWGWSESIAMFQIGKAAMMQMTSEFGNILEDKASSKFWDKIGYIAMVPGPAGPGNVMGGSGWCVNEDSENAELAYKFVEWANSEDVLRRVIAKSPESAGVPRVSILHDEEMKKNFKWYPAYEAALNVGWFTPMCRNWFNCGEKLGTFYHKAILGEMTVAKALETLQVELEKLKPWEQGIKGAEL